MLHPISSKEGNLRRFDQVLYIDSTLVSKTIARHASSSADLHNLGGALHAVHAFTSFAADVKGNDGVSTGISLRPR